MALVSCNNLSGINKYYRRNTVNPGSISSSAAASIHALQQMLAEKEDGASERVLLKQKRGENGSRNKSDGGGVRG